MTVRQILYQLRYTPQLRELFLITFDTSEARGVLGLRILLQQVYLRHTPSRVVAWLL